MIIASKQSCRNITSFKLKKQHTEHSIAVTLLPYSYKTMSSVALKTLLQLCLSDQELGYHLQRFFEVGDRFWVMYGATDNIRQTWQTFLIIMLSRKSEVLGVEDNLIVQYWHVFLQSHTDILRLIQHCAQYTTQLSNSDVPYESIACCIQWHVMHAVRCVCCWCAVVVYCHSRRSRQMRFLFRAQDRNMTNGDFAFFTYTSSTSDNTFRPWNRYVDDPLQIPYRRKAFYAVKQVPVALVALWVVFDAGGIVDREVGAALVDMSVNQRRFDFDNRYSSKTTAKSTLDSPIVITNDGSLEQKIVAPVSSSKFPSSSVSSRHKSISLSRLQFCNAAYKLNIFILHKLLRFIK